MSPRFHYSQSDLAEAISRAGIEPGDTVFCHAGLLKLGLPAELAQGADALDVAFNAFKEVLGPQGTLLTPTFTYSFCKREVFDPLRTASQVGPFGEALRQLPGAARSLEPIFSVAGLGPQAQTLFANLPHNCFGPGCLYDRLGQGRAKLLLLGVDYEFCTALHHLEQTAGSPHRYLKLFHGKLWFGGNLVKQSWLYNVRCLAEACEPKLERAGPLLDAAGLGRKIALGLGEIRGIGFGELYDFFGPKLTRKPMLFAANPLADPLAEEEKRVGRRVFEVRLEPGADMREIVHALWRLPRDIVSDGFSAALEALAGIIPLKIFRAKTGSECFTWIIPEKWTCREAYLEDIQGNRIFSYADNPLHVVSYSLPVEAVVSRSELLEHLHAHPRLVDAIPYVFKYYERDWGLCASRETIEGLTDERYRVRIDTDFSCANLEAGHWLLPGERPESLVICAHLCHPHQAIDDLSGVAAAVELMRRLAAKPRRRFSYRLLITPEAVGSAAWLSRHEELIPGLIGGLFLEMLASPERQALQHSRFPDSPLDCVAGLIVRERDPEALIAPFLGVVLNDERMFNAPGINVPMLCLSRAWPQSEGRGHYATYHSSFDTAENADYANLEASLQTALAIIEAFEADEIPLPRFKGELFCSRYSGIDYASMEREIFEVMFRLDGVKSVSQIALESGLSFGAVRSYLDILAGHGLIEFGG